MDLEEKIKCIADYFKRTYNGEEVEVKEYTTVNGDEVYQIDVKHGSDYKRISFGILKDALNKYTLEEIQQQIKEGKLPLEELLASRFILIEHQ